MPSGDHGSGSKLEPVMCNVLWGPDGKIAECGVGYFIVLPSGFRREGGFTWHRPSSSHHAPGEYVDALQQVMDELLRAAAHHEGVEIIWTETEPSVSERQVREK